MLRNVERTTIFSPSSAHALTLAPGLPSLSACFSGTPSLSAVLGSPQFLTWCVSQSSAVVDRIERLRVLHPSAADSENPGRQLWRLETEILLRHYAIMRHALWFSEQSDELASHVLTLMGFTADGAGISAFVRLLKSHFSVAQDRVIAMTLLDLMYVLCLHKDATLRDRRCVAKLFRAFLCGVYSTSQRDLISLPPDVPRLVPIPNNILRPAKKGNWEVNYSLRCLYSLLTPVDAAKAMAEIVNALELFDTDIRGWGDSLEEHPVFRALNEATFVSVKKKHLKKCTHSYTYMCVCMCVY